MQSQRLLMKQNHDYSAKVAVPIAIMPAIKVKLTCTINS